MIDVSAARVRVLCDSALHPDEINAEAERKQAEAAALKLREKLGHRDYVLSKLTFAKATNHLRVKQHNSWQCFPNKFTVPIANLCFGTGFLKVRQYIVI